VNVITHYTVLKSYKNEQPATVQHSIGHSLQQVHFQIYLNYSFYKVHIFLTPIFVLCNIILVFSLSCFIIQYVISSFYVLLSNQLIQSVGLMSLSGTTLWQNFTVVATSSHC